MADRETVLVKYFPAAEGSEIRLLEVSRSAPTTHEVLPFGFAADHTHGIDYPSVVILLSPEEWTSVQDQDLKLPAGWDLSTAEDL
jgi:hypothetical protein